MALQEDSDDDELLDEDYLNMNETDGKSSGGLCNILMASFPWSQRMCGIRNRPILNSSRKK